MPKRLRDNPLDQDQSKTKRYYDKDLRPFFERINEENPIRTATQSERIEIQEKRSDSVYQSAQKAYGISTDEFYIDYYSDDGDDDDPDFY